MKYQSGDSYHFGIGPTLVLVLIPTDYTDYCPLPMAHPLDSLLCLPYWISPYNQHLGISPEVSVQP